MSEAKPEDQVGWYDFVEYGMNMAAKMSDPPEKKIREMGVVGSMLCASQAVADKLVKRLYPRRTVVARFVGDANSEAEQK